MDRLQGETTDRSSVSPVRAPANIPAPHPSQQRARSAESPARESSHIDRYPLSPGRLAHKPIKSPFRTDYASKVRSDFVSRYAGDASLTYSNHTASSMQRAKESPIRFSNTTRGRTLKKSTSNSRVSTRVSKDDQGKAYLSKRYASQLDQYIVSMDAQQNKSDSPSARNTSARENSYIASYRYPSPTEYAQECYPLKEKSIGHSQSLSPEANPRSPFRFPSPPEYNHFYRENQPDERIAVDASESVLADRASMKESESEGILVAAEDGIESSVEDCEDEEVDSLES